MIELKSANKYFNRHKRNEIHVINNASITFPDSGLVAILGPSGCGKTTMLNAIGGLDKLNSGSIFINGKKIAKRRSRKVDEIRNLNIGYIFQDYKLVEGMSVFDNVALSLKILGIKDKEEIKKRVMYTLEKVKMERYKNRPVGMLSGGERQRVGIARALVKNPDIILADEPTGNLDSKNTIEIMNIIKSISKDKLVILVTHEVELAKFYATRIIEVVDGTIEKDYQNKNKDNLDYRIDNKFYLKDFKYHEENKDNNINIDMYSDTKEKLNLVIIFKNGNLYIKNKDNDKVEVIDSSSNIELINDNYKQLDKSVYEKYSFDFDKIINNNIKLKYSSIFNIFTIFSNGFKKVFDYSFVKKLLLIGFFLSSLFVTYSVSNLLGVATVNDKDFIKTNKNYLMLESKKVSVSDYNKYSEMDGINYILPGDSNANFNIDTKDYYQTENVGLIIGGSIASTSMISKDNLVYGRMPENEYEIVIDKMTYKRAENIKMVGLYDIERMLDTKVYLGNHIIEYTIVGITDLESPSIYVDNNQFINIIDNSSSDSMFSYGNERSNGGSVYDYTLYKDKISIVKGRTPDNDYEVIVNENLKDTFKLDKYIDDLKVNGEKLKVVGYYTSSDEINSYFVNTNTNKYELIGNSQNLVIYASDKDKTIRDFKELDRKVIDVYDADKKAYLKENKESMNASLIVAAIMLGISLVEIILMTRSSFLSRIKEVGIYRAIGVKKSDIYKMFMGEAFAITTLTSIPGVLFMGYCINVISDIKYISRNYIMNWGVILLCIVILYVFNIVVSLIPVFNTMRKTPAQILARHDLD
jgi:ABC-type lipoprotein export system ATPase subunit/ABC-type antimicrobial peptide transport system permease subunit